MLYSSTLNFLFIGADLSGLEQEIVRLVSEQYEIESENALD